MFSKSNILLAAILSVGMALPMSNSAIALPAGAQRPGTAASDMLVRVQQKHRVSPGRHGYVAGGRGYRGRGGHYGGNAAAVGAGLAVMGIIGAAAAASAAQAQPACYLQRQPVYDQWGNYRGTRRVQVCE